jgi:hypothetical protein
MRLGKIRQRLDLVIDVNKHIFIDHEVLYNNEVYKVKNYRLVIEALKSVKDFDWVGQDFVAVQEVINEKSENKNLVELSQAEFSKLNSYVGALNQKLPIFYDMLNSVVQDQDEKIINIKLPANVNSFDDLNKLNNRLYDVFKLYNLDGQFDFVGFEKGSNWYVIIATGHFSYLALVGGLNIANKYFQAKKMYYDSENSRHKAKKAKLDYMAAKETSEKPTEAELEKYIKRRLDLEVDEEVEMFIEKSKISKGNENENKIKIKKAVRQLIKELEKEDFEFHLSLNPPKYVNDEKGEFNISYSSLPAIKDKNEVKKINSKNEEIKKQD